MIGPEARDLNQMGEAERQRERERLKNGYIIDKRIDVDINNDSIFLKWFEKSKKQLEFESAEIIAIDKDSDFDNSYSISDLT